MTKIGLVLTSFVAAIPGAGLAALMVMAFLNHSGGPSMWTKALAGMLFVVGTLLTLMPFGILVFAGPKAEKAPKKQKGEAEGAAVVEAESGEAVVAADDEEGASGSPFAVTDDNLQVVDSSADDLALTGEVVTGDEDLAEAAEDDSDFEVNALEGSEADLFEMDEEEPKKGKKK